MYFKITSFRLYPGKKNPEFELQELKINFKYIEIILKYCNSI